MALKKTKLTKGAEANYWVIMNYQSMKNTNTTIIGLGLFYNQAAREASLDNVLEYTYITVDGIDLLRSELYSEIKKSRIENEIEQNWFADAEDVL